MTEFSVSQMTQKDLPLHFQHCCARREKAVTQGAKGVEKTTAFFSKWGVPRSAGPHSLLEMWQWFRVLRVSQSLGTQMG